MVDIVQGVQRVAAIMGEISVASAEQSAGIELIHRAIGNMDESTQQNAALVEEAASAADSLRESAAGLAKRVRIFKIAEHQPAARSARAIGETRKGKVRAAELHHVTV
jgi:methyl-accepting chemotaxis protein